MGVKKELANTSAAQEKFSPPFSETRLVPPPEKLVEGAKIELFTTLGREFDVPEPPKELSADLAILESLGIRRFDAHFLPDIHITEREPFRDREPQPDSWFWKKITEGTLPEDAATLKSGWYLIDSRTKPDYTGGTQMYEDDYMSDFMAYLRDEGKIENRFKLADSRFGASPREIEDVILPELAVYTGINGRIRNMMAMEFYFLGNMAYPEWGETTTWHIFSDAFVKEDMRVIGGGSQAGGLSYYYCNSADLHDDDFAFSPIIEYHPKVVLT